MQLVEKLAPLGIGNLRVAGRLAKRPVRVKRLERRLGFVAHQGDLIVGRVLSDGLCGDDTGGAGAQDDVVHVGLLKK